MKVSDMSAARLGQQVRAPVMPAAARWRRAALLRRILMILLVVAQTLIGTYYMLAVLPYHGGTSIEKALAVLFALLFAWISAGFWIAVFGFVVRRLGGDRLSPLRRHGSVELAAAPLGRTAIVMPIRHEPIEHSLRGLRAVYRSLERTGRLDAFDFFILSDSRDPDVWLAEQLAWYHLCRDLNAFQRLHYRRRAVNLNYKSGNIADFLRRWGRGYDYMIVLDADSLLGGDTLLRMVQLMVLEPRIGILQTNPAIVNGRTLFARIHQFANRLYGPLFAAGLGAIQLGDAAYWGHNAIIRVEPFMRHCGLRRLPAFGLFSGPILSHDFAEAAYMGRAGFEVWLEPELAHSYEEFPPTLDDELRRDRRWAKGNLQHLWLLLFGRGIRFTHRMVFLNGIFSYLASPLWLAFLALTTFETTRLTLWPINYFPEPHSLFPLWPEWHPQWALGLAATTTFLLFFPKLLAVVDAVLAGVTQAFGGFIRMILSVLAELLVSTLLAPIRMLAQTRYVGEALLNLRLQWGGQNRSAETPWRSALLKHTPGAVMAAGWAAFAFWLKPLFFFWSLPVALPLVLAAPISVWLSRRRFGARWRRRGLLAVPEDTAPPELLRDLSGPPILPLVPEGMSHFEHAVLVPYANAVHLSLARLRGGGARRMRLRELRERCLREGPEALTRYEIALLAQDRESLAWFHRAAWRSPLSSHWGRLLERVSTVDPFALGVKNLGTVTDLSADLDSVQR